MFALFFYFIENVMELKDIFEEKCWLTKIGRKFFWMSVGVCVYCDMVTYCMLFCFPLYDN